MKLQLIPLDDLFYRGIYSIRSQGCIIFGFDTLENGSIIGMGNTDIDSIGRYANAYDGSRELQERNGSIARFFVPFVLLIFDKLIVIIPSSNLLL